MTNTSHNVLLTPPSDAWTEEQCLEFKNWIVSHLKEGLVTVTFNKKDGEQRIMECTLSSEIIPTKPVVEGKETKVKKENPNVVSVYDVNAEGWRSFILKNVTNVTFKLD